MLNFLSLKFIIPIAIVLATIIGWKYIDLKLEISNQKKEIETLTKKNLVQITDLQTERSNVTILKSTIIDLNKSIDKYQARNQNLLDSLEKFKQQSVSEKYKSEQAIKLMESELFKSNECKSGLELNQMISELKYEDL